MADKPRACFPFVFPFLTNTAAACSAGRANAGGASTPDGPWAEKCAWGPLICAGSLMAMRIQGESARRWPTAWTHSACCRRAPRRSQT